MTLVMPPFRITVCGIGELAGHTNVAATHVLSILDPAEPVPEAFEGYGAHARLELRFDDIIRDTAGLIMPQPADVRQILAFGQDLMTEARQDASLLIHCHAGISRSTAAMTLILAQAMPDQSAASIIGIVHGIREKAWPNLRIIEIGDSMLARQGSLVAAAADLYQLQLEKRPKLADFMEQSGRKRELEAAAASAYAQRPIYERETGFSSPAEE